MQYSPSNIRRVATACFIGSTIEWYGFFIYGTASALVLSRKFFPTHDQTIGLLLSFSSFGLAFIVRPLGGAVFGFIGDRYGRKTSLIATLVGMGLSTGCIAFLPTYTQIGLGAPILLVALRIVQGICVGGEFGGAVLLAIEHGSHERKGVLGNLVQMGSPAGQVLGAVVFLLVELLPRTHFESWGWRVPFLLALPLLFVGIYMRLKIAESPVFEAITKDSIRVANPIITVLRNHLSTILLLAGSYLGVGAVVYTLSTYALSYGTRHLGYSSTTVLLFVLAAMVARLVTMPLFAKVSDRVGHKKVFIASLIGMVGLTYPWLLLFLSGKVSLGIVGYLALYIPEGVNFGVMAALFAKSMPATLAHSGISLGYQVGTAIGGGLTPVVVTAIVAATGTVHAAAWFVMAACLVSLLCCIAIPDISKSRRPRIKTVVDD